MSTLKQRFAAKWSESESGCWIWTAGKYAGGYGSIMRGRKSAGTKRSDLAHRVSYELHRGPIPEGMHVLHRCDVRACVNPDHLFIGTNNDNIADSMKKGRRKGVPRNRPSGLKYRPWTDEAKKRKRRITDHQIAEAQSLRQRGFTYQAIGEKLGFNKKIYLGGLRLCPECV